LDDPEAVLSELFSAYQSLNSLKEQPHLLQWVYAEFLTPVSIPHEKK
jgi:hypothetical protein